MANKAMGALKHFWRSNKVDTHAKYLIYMAIPLNLLLWGCESWALPQSSLAKLEAFHHTTIRRILQITWDDVRTHHIKNMQVRQSFNDITTVEQQILKRQLTFFGKLIRDNPQSPTQNVLTAWYPATRSRGRPHLTTRKSIIRNLRKIIPQTLPTAT